MAKKCPNCGNEVADNATFCTSCGAQLNDGVKQSYNGSKPPITPRNIGITILLTIVTCGIYGIYWLVKMTDDSNLLVDGENTTGGMTVLFVLITCGIYSIYWNYKMGQKLYEAGKKYGKDIKDNSVLYLVLSLVGFGIISWCLIQSDLNKLAE